MKYFAIILNTLVIVTGLFFVTNVYAQVETTPTGPGISTSFVNCGWDTAECTVNDLIGPNGLIQRALNWVFMMVGFFGAILFMYAGFLMISAAGNPAQINKARGIFKNVLIGFIIILAAVLIVKQALTYINANAPFTNIITQ